MGVSAERSAVCLASPAGQRLCCLAPSMPGSALTTDGMSQPYQRPFYGPLPPPPPPPPVPPVGQDEDARRAQLEQLQREHAADIADWQQRYNQASLDLLDKLLTGSLLGLPHDWCLAETQGWAPACLRPHILTCLILAGTLGRAAPRQGRPVPATPRPGDGRGAAGGREHRPPPHQRGGCAPLAQRLPLQALPDLLLTPSGGSGGSIAHGRGAGSFPALAAGCFQESKTAAPFCTSLLPFTACSCSANS